MENLQLSLFEQLSRVEPQLSDAEVVGRLCHRLLDESGVTPPVNVGLLASLRGIVRVEERVQPWAGVLNPEDGVLVVGVRTSDGRERQRFTVLHEAGHTMLPGFAESRQFRCAARRTRDEELCDIAASELLLPRRFFGPDLRDVGFSLDGVETLAGWYEASIEATALRAVDLSDHPAVLAVFRVAHKPTEYGHEEEVEPKLRLAWLHTQGSWPYMKRHKSVDEGSPFIRAYEGEVVDEVAELGGIASDEVGRVRIRARRYGSDGRVLALIDRAPVLTGAAS